MWLEQVYEALGYLRAPEQSNETDCKIILLVNPKIQLDNISTILGHSIQLRGENTSNLQGMRFLQVE